MGDAGEKRKCVLRIRVRHVAKAPATPIFGPGGNVADDAVQLQQTLRLARWSAALGTIGLLTAVFGIGVLLALIAILFAIAALNELTAVHSADAQGIALIGLLAGVLSLLVFPLLLAAAVPRFVAAKQNANHVRCYGNLSAIEEAKQEWVRRHHVSRGSIVQAREVLRMSAENGERLRCPSGGKYSVGIVGVPARCSIPLHNEPPDRYEPPGALRLSQAR